MSKPINNKTLGGVTYNANTFEGKALKDGKYQLTSKNGGETLIFGQQQDGKIEVRNGIFDTFSNFTISNIKGAEFKSSKKTMCNVDVNDCENVTVDLAHNKTIFCGDVANIKGGKNNEVILDSKDYAYIKDEKIKGEGTAAQKDY